MNMMKCIVIAILLAASCTACKKNNEATLPFKIEGYWEGHLGSGAATPASQFALLIKPGGVLERINGNGGVSGTGTWQVSGDIFTGHYDFTNSPGSASVAAIIDKANNKLVSGTWGTGYNTSGSGTWYADKVNN